MLSFHVSGKQAFEISIGDVSQTAIQGKADCVLEFHRDDNAGANSTEVPYSAWMGWGGMGWDGMGWEGGVIRAERPLQHCLYSSTLFSPPLIPSSPYNDIHFYCPSVPYQYVSIIKHVFLFFIYVFLGTRGVQKDSLVELSFHIPPTNHQFVGDEDKPSAVVFKDKILDRADVGPTDDTSVVDFGGCQLLTPRWDGWDGLGRMGRRWGWEGDGGAGGILRHCCSG